MDTFWNKLKHPIFVMAPMENVTDTVFRQIISRCGAPDVFFTEFTSTDGILSPGRGHVEQRLKFTPSEKPIVAQIFGTNPEHFKQTAAILTKMGFDGIDINMGCPDRHIVKKGSCSGLIKNPPLAKEIILATMEGANGIPVSVKTRLGHKSSEIETWIPDLLLTNIAALTIHARTVSDMSKVPARWDEIAMAVKIRNNLKSKTLIIGNGDIKTHEEALEKIKMTGADGIMIGRGIFQNPWIFNKDFKPENITLEKRIELLIEHIELFYDTWGDTKSFDIMRKFYKMYINDFPNASDLRVELMSVRSVEQTLTILKNFIRTL